MTDFRARVGAVKAALCFGEAAQAAGLKGASRSGWTCPACETERALKERRDGRGARCQTCELGFDVPGVVMTGRGLSAIQALTLLERVIAERDAARAGRASDELFSHRGETK